MLFECKTLMRLSPRYMDGFLRYFIRCTRSLSCVHAILMPSSKIDNKKLTISVGNINVAVGARSEGLGFTR